MTILVGWSVGDSRGDRGMGLGLSHSNRQRAPTLSIERRQRKYVSRAEARFDFTSNRRAVCRGHDWVTDATWEFVIGLAFEASAGPCLANSAPLFEEERNAAPLALIPKRQDPFFLYWPGAGPALTTHDHPVDASQVQFAHVLQQRLNGEKTNLRICVSQVLDAR